MWGPEIMCDNRGMNIQLTLTIKCKIVGATNIMLNWYNQHEAQIFNIFFIIGNLVHVSDIY
jgi:hypothetical protein